MSQRLKRWESPRREGRNDKGRGGSARQRQKQKQMKLLRQRLKSGDSEKPQQSIEGRENNSLPFLFALQLFLFYLLCKRTPIAFCRPTSIDLCRHKYSTAINATPSKPSPV